MKILTSAILLITLVACCSSCKKDLIGEGPVTVQTRSIANFSVIDLRMNGSVYYSNDTSWKVEVSAKQSIHDILETTVVDNRLLIRYRNGKTYDADESIRVTVSGPGVNSFKTNSSGSIYCVNPINVPALYARSSGSGSIYLQRLNGSKMEAESLVSGRIVLSAGSLSEARIKTDGSGKVDLSGALANNVTGRIIGSGDIRVHAINSLDARIDGSGSFYFTGSPTITSHIYGSGRLIRF